MFRKKKKKNCTIKQLEFSPQFYIFNKNFTSKERETQSTKTVCNSKRDLKKNNNQNQTIIPSTIVFYTNKLDKLFSTTTIKIKIVNKMDKQRWTHRRYPDVT